MMVSALQERDNYPVYLVDDDEAVRDSLTAILSAAGYRVETFASGESFLDGADVSTCGCLLLDLKMPGMSGAQVQEALASKATQLQLIVLSGYGDIATAVSAMKTGAADFIEKPVAPARLIETVGDAMRRIDQKQHEGARVHEAKCAVARLTAREREVLTQLVDSNQNKVIAQKLGISPRTVEVHRARIMDKLQAKSLSMTLRIALLAGLDESPD